MGFMHLESIESLLNSIELFIIYLGALFRWNYGEFLMVNSILMFLVVIMIMNIDGIEIIWRFPSCYVFDATRIQMSGCPADIQVLL